MGAFEKYRIELLDRIIGLFDDSSDYYQWAFIAAALIISLIIGTILSRTLFAPRSRCMIPMSAPFPS